MLLFCVQCCELDPMLDDNIEMAKKLRDLGNEVHVDVLQELPHGFLNFSLISTDARYFILLTTFT